MNPLDILVVDDDVDHAESIAEILAIAEHRVALATTGAQAVSKAREQRFDLVLMDYLLPGMNGIEASIEIREVSPGTDVFLMTGYRLQQLFGKLVQRGDFQLLSGEPPAKVLQAFKLVAPEGVVALGTDQAELTARLEVALREQGEHPVVVRSARDALQEDVGRPFTVMLLDLGAPLLQGLELYAKRRKAGHPLPAIVVVPVPSEAMGRGDVFRSPRISGCLYKPIDMEHLLDTVARVRLKQGRR